MAVDHYENFPVASFLLPARLRPAVKVIYDFARSADDIADEGDATPPERLRALDIYENLLHEVSMQASTAPMPILFSRLGEVISTWNLPIQPFFDLLSAFKQDVGTTRYADFDSLLDYCHRSANPVGTLMLHLYSAATPSNLQQSNAICSALQIINFLQDVAIDWAKGRIYLPANEMARHGVLENQIRLGIVDKNWIALMNFQVRRARELMLSGAPLALRLPGRVGWELRLVVNGGLQILRQLEYADYDIFTRRPILKGRDWIVIAWRSLIMRSTTINR